MPYVVLRFHGCINVIHSECRSRSPDIVYGLIFTKFGELVYLWTKGAEKYQSQYTWLPPVPYLRVNMGCALAIFFFFSGPLPLRSYIGQSTFRGLFPGVPSLNRLYSEIDQIHLSIEAQCGTAYLPMGDCHIVCHSPCSSLSGRPHH